MIRHLNPEGFRTFHTILQGNSVSAKPNHHSVFLPEGTVSSYRSVAPLWLGAESGLTILAVSADGENFEEFYLDKAIRVKSGIWFRLTGFDGRASVQMGGISMPLSNSALAALRHIIWGDPKRLFSFQLDEMSLRQLGDASEAYLMTRLERGFRTLDFYKALGILEDCK